MLYNGFPSIVSVSIDFPSYAQRDAPFHCIAYDYSCADWDTLCDHLRHVPWEDILKHSASAAATKCVEWVQVAIEVYKSGQASPISMVFISFYCCHGS